jgi:hypothetical protein
MAVSARGLTNQGFVRLGVKVDEARRDFQACTIQLCASVFAHSIDAICAHHARLKGSPPRFIEYQTVAGEKSRTPATPHSLRTRPVDRTSRMTNAVGCTQMESPDAFNTV